jgi:hypothetical protein
VVKEYGIVKLVKNQKKQKEQIGNGKIVRKQMAALGAALLTSIPYSC